MIYKLKENKIMCSLQQNDIYWENRKELEQEPCPLCNSSEFCVACEEDNKE